MFWDSKVQILGVGKYFIIGSTVLINEFPLVVDIAHFIGVWSRCLILARLHFANICVNSFLFINRHLAQIHFLSCGSPFWEFCGTIRVQICLVALVRGVGHDILRNRIIFIIYVI